MTTEHKSKFTVISNQSVDRTNIVKEVSPDINYHTNPMYEKLLNFRNLQEQQQKRFSVDDLFKLC